MATIPKKKLPAITIIKNIFNALKREPPPNSHITMGNGSGMKSSRYIVSPWMKIACNLKWNVYALLPSIYSSNIPLPQDIGAQEVNAIEKWRINIWHVTLNEVFDVFVRQPHEIRVHLRQFKIKQRIWINVMWECMSNAPFAVVHEQNVNIQHSMIITHMQIVMTTDATPGVKHATQ